MFMLLIINPQQLTYSSPNIRGDNCLLPNNSLSGDYRLPLLTKLRTELYNNQIKKNVTSWDSAISPLPWPIAHHYSPIKRSVVHLYSVILRNGTNSIQNRYAKGQKT